MKKEPKNFCLFGLRLYREGVAMVRDVAVGFFGGVVLWTAAAVAQTPSVQVPSVQVTGMVAHPGPVALGALKPVVVSASFHTMHGQQSHRWSGPLLLDVVNAASVVDAPGKRTHMQHVILARGADGYAVAIAIGEIEPGGEGKHVIVALLEDDKPIPAPRIVVPGDSSFTRGVHDLAELSVR